MFNQEPKAGNIPPPTSSSVAAHVMKGSPTPTPWGCELAEHEWIGGRESGAFTIYNIEHQEIGRIRGVLGFGAAKANAEFIVRAVNCHDELVEALEEASLEVGILLGAYEQPEDDIRTRIESVLAKVKAPEVKE